MNSSKSRKRTWSPFGKQHCEERSAYDSSSSSSSSNSSSPVLFSGPAIRNDQKEEEEEEEDESFPAKNDQDDDHIDYHHRHQKIPVIGNAPRKNGPFRTNASWRNGNYQQSASNKKTTIATKKSKKDERLIFDTTCRLCAIMVDQHDANIYGYDNQLEHVRRHLRQAADLLQIQQWSIPPIEEIAKNCFDVLVLPPPTSRTTKKNKTNNRHRPIDHEIDFHSRNDVLGGTVQILKCRPLECGKFGISVRQQHSADTEPEPELALLQNPYPVELVVQPDKDHRYVEPELVDHRYVDPELGSFAEPDPELGSYADPELADPSRPIIRLRDAEEAISTTERANSDDDDDDEDYEEGEEESEASGGKSTSKSSMSRSERSRRNKELAVDQLITIYNDPKLRTNFRLVQSNGIWPMFVADGHKYRLSRVYNNGKCELRCATNAGPCTGKAYIVPDGAQPYHLIALGAHTHRPLVKNKKGGGDFEKYVPREEKILKRSAANNNGGRK